MIDIEALKVIEKRIKERPIDDIRDRWECGKMLLTERVKTGKRGRPGLPKERMAEVSKELEVGTTELCNRMQAAEQHPTESNFSSWLEKLAAQIGRQPKWTQAVASLSKVGKRQRKSSQTKATPELEQEVTEAVELGKPVSRKRIAAKYGVGEKTVQSAHERAKGRQDALENEATVINWASIPKTSQQKLEIARRQIRKQIERDFRTHLLAELDQHRAKLNADLTVHKAALDAEAKRLTEIRNKDWEHYRAVIAAHKGAFTRAEYDLIRSCLHPDSRLSASEEKLAKAFRLFDDERIKAAIINGSMV